MAAMMEGREFVGIDLNKDYCEISQRRIEWAREKSAMPLLQLIEDTQPEPQQTSLFS